MHQLQLCKSIIISDQQQHQDASTGINWQQSLVIEMDNVTEQFLCDYNKV